MFRLPITLILLLLTTSAAQAQWADWERLPGPTGGMINSFAEVGGDIVAAPKGGAFYRSTDGGVTWAFLYGASWTRNTSVLHGAADGMLYALGYSGSYRSSDRGQSWTKCAPGGMALYAASASDGTVLFGMRGELAVSTDKGETWTTATPLPGGTRDYKVAVDIAGDWYAGAYQTGLFRSTDRGLSWESIEPGLPNNAVYSISVPAGDAVYAGLNNASFRSTDRGATWQAISGLEGLNVYSFQHAGGSTMVAETSAGLYLSTDFGATWDTGTLAPFIETYGMFARRNGHLLFSSEGRVWRSSDRGANFAISDEGLYLQNITAITSMNRGHVLVGCEEGGLYLSTDDGETWQYATPGRWGYSVRKIEASDSETDFAATVLTDDGEILYHRFGDTAWRVLEDSLGGEPFLDFYGNDVLFAVTSTGRFLVKSLGDSPWVERGRIQPASGSITAARLSRGGRSDPNEDAWLCATDRGLYRSVNEGLTWDLVLVDGLPTWMTDISSYTFYDRREGYRYQLYACSSDRLYSCTDGGRTWIRETLALTHPRELRFNAHGDFYLLDGDIIRFFQRPPYGKAWREFPALPLGGATALSFVGEGRDHGALLIGTASQGILRSSRSTLGAPTLETSASRVTISGMYPLPLAADGRLHLQLELQRPGDVRVEICDVLGRVLQRHERGNLPAGRSDLTISINARASSMLLLRMVGPGGAVQRLLPVLSVLR